MKIAQRFSAGSGSTTKPEPATRATELTGDGQFKSSVVRFTDLRSFLRSDPSAEALGYFHPIRYRGRLTTFFFWANRLFEFD
jgi:hypothetical protein